MFSGFLFHVPTVLIATEHGGRNVVLYCTFMNRETFVCFNQVEKESKGEKAQILGEKNSPKIHSKRRPSSKNQNKWIKKYINCTEPNIYGLNLFFMGFVAICTIIRLTILQEYISPFLEQQKYFYKMAQKMFIFLQDWAMHTNITTYKTKNE